MAYELKEGSGSLFKNDRKEKDKNDDLILLRDTSRNADQHEQIHIDFVKI